MKFRIYRVMGHVEYKDVEATDPSSAYKHHTDPKEEFIITDSGCILFGCLDYAFDKEKTLQDLRIEANCNV